MEKRLKQSKSFPHILQKFKVGSTNPA